MLEAYLDMLSLYFIEKMLENLSVSVETEILSAKIFMRKVMTLQFCVSQLWTYNSWFFSYDLPAWRYRYAFLKNQIP